VQIKAVATTHPLARIIVIIIIVRTNLTRRKQLKLSFTKLLILTKH